MVVSPAVRAFQKTRIGRLATADNSYQENGDNAQDGQEQCHRNYLTEVHDRLLVQQLLVPRPARVENTWNDPQDNPVKWHSKMLLLSQGLYVREVSPGFARLAHKRARFVRVWPEPLAPPVAGWLAIYLFFDLTLYRVYLYAHVMDGFLVVLGPAW